MLVLNIINLCKECKLRNAYKHDKHVTTANINWLQKIWLEALLAEM